MNKHLLATLLFTGVTLSSVHAQVSTTTATPFIPPLDVTMTLLEQSPALASTTTVTSQTTTMEVTATASTTLISSTTVTESEHAGHGTPVATQTKTETVEETIAPVVATETSGQTPIVSTTVTTVTSETTLLTPVSDTIMTTTISETMTTTTSQTVIPSPHTEHITPDCATSHTEHPSELKGFDNASTRNYVKGMAKMHKDMDITYTGDSDIDFLRGMIAHHQGAVAMARTVLEYGKDKQVRRLAKEIIAAQNREIITMQKWLEQMEKKAPRISSDMPRSGNWTDENWVGETWLNER